jgi:hypothetical protein
MNKDNPYFNVFNITIWCFELSFLLFT